MEKRKTLVLLALLILTCFTAHVLGADNVDIELTADFMGKYIWRGQNVTDDPVFQPGFSFSKDGLTASLWGNLELTNVNDKSGDFSELDYILDYSSDLSNVEGVGYSIGMIYYDFPSRASDGSKTPDTVEVYWGLNFDLPLNPSITVYHDIDEAEGSYVSLAFEHSIEKVAELSPNLPVGIEIGANLGWGSGSYNKYYWGTDQNKLQDLAFSVAFPMEMADWKVAPSLNYVTLVSDDIRDTDVYGTDSDFFFAGLSLSKKF